MKCLRSEEPKKKNISPNDGDESTNSEENIVPKSNCLKKHCQECQEEIGVLLDKVKIELFLYLFIYYLILFLIILLSLEIKYFKEIRSYLSRII